MGAFFVYIVKSSACLILFYLFYRLLLSKDTFHRFNRIGLLGMVLLSVVIPFFRITVHEPIVMQPAVLDLETLLLMASLVGERTLQTVPFWMQLLLWVYIGGVFFFFCQFIYSCGCTIRMIRKGTVSRLENGIRLVITPKAVTPFSWMRYILVSQNDMDESGREILTHELAHIRLHHSIDLLISEICILFHWFNPVAWLLKQELQNIHEFEADEDVLIRGVDAKKYQLLLIKKAVGSQRFTSMANSLNHSSLKKRITMMLKRKSNPWARLKYLCVLPLAAIAVVSFARPEIVRELDKISSVKFNEIVPVKEITVVKNVEKPVSGDSTTISRPVVLNVGKIVRIDSVINTSGPVFLELGDFDLDCSLLSGQLEHLDFSGINISDFDFSRIRLNIDSITNMGNYRLDTAQIRQLREAYRTEMKLNPEEWKTQQLTQEQLLALKETMEKTQKQISEQQVVIEKAVAQQQKGMIAKQKIARILPSGVYVVIDGKEASDKQLQELAPESIESLSVLKNESAVEKYGEKARKGAVTITTKKKK